MLRKSYVMPVIEVKEPAQVKELEQSLIIKHLDHKATVEEQERIYEWISSGEDNRAEYYRIVELWAVRNMRIHSSEHKVEDAVKKFNEEVNRRNSKKRMRRLLTFTSTVAAVMAIALITIGVSSLKQKYEWHTFSAGPDDGVQQFELNDGTKVFLNSSSELAFRDDFNTRRRNVRLKGEAYFEVVSNPMRPFVIDAGGVDVRVLGTSFNVKTGDTVEAVLEKGKVALENKDGQLIAEMKPGQKASFDPVTGTVDLEYTNTTKYTAWRFDQEVYESISFLEIVDLIEERYGVMVSLSADILDGNRYRLVIGNDESLQEVMETLKYIAPIEYTIDNNHVKIKIKKPTTTR